MSIKSNFRKSIRGLLYRQEFCFWIKKELLDHAQEVKDKNYARSLFFLIFFFLISHVSFADGFYLGGQLGYEWTKFQRSDTISSPGLPLQIIAENKGVRTSSLSGGPFLGYTWYLKNKNFFVSFEGYGLFDSLKNTQSLQQGNDTYISAFQKTFSYGAALRGGVHLMQGTYGYIRLGGEASRFKQTFQEISQNNMRQEYTQSTTQAALVPGVGIEKAFGKWTTRLEYKAAFYPALNTRLRDMDDSILNQNRQSNTIQSINLGLSYQF